MRKRKKSPTYFTLLIPGIFMAVLGIGNILLGSFKYEQYEEVLLTNQAELLNSNFQQTNNFSKLSPLQKLKNTENSSSRLLALVRKAEARRDLYSLVIYGGKVFLIFSILLIVGAIIKKFIEDNRLSNESLKTEI